MISRWKCVERCKQLFAVLLCSRETPCTMCQVEFDTLPPIMVKGKSMLIPIFRPRMTPYKFAAGSTEDGVILPWTPTSTVFAGHSPLTELTNYNELKVRAAQEKRRSRGFRTAVVMFWFFSSPPMIDGFDSFSNVNFILMYILVEWLPLPV